MNVCSYQTRRRKEVRILNKVDLCCINFSCRTEFGFLFLDLCALIILQISSGSFIRLECKKTNLIAILLFSFFTELLCNCQRLCMFSSTYSKWGLIKLETLWKLSENWMDAGFFICY